MSKLRTRIAYFLVEVANQLVRPLTKKELSYNYWPKFRPIDEQIKQRGSYVGHKYSCGAYSYEHLKSSSDQDGPDGYGATETIKRFISEEGWADIGDLKHDDGTPYTAQEAADMISKDLTLEATRQEQRELNEL